MVEASPDLVRVGGRSVAAIDDMEFPSGGTQIIDWPGRMEAWFATQPAGSDYLGLRREFTWLREA
eukprot:3219337-Lingulodinium_polyedra.AAC.1